MTQRRLVLASQSPARKRLLKRLGVRFSVCPAHLDELAVQKKIRDPKKLVLELSRLKARAVAESQPQAVIIGSDQVLVCDGRIYGKPGTPERARRQLATFSGKTVQLMTAVCVRQPSGREQAFVHQTRMRFRRLSAGEIRDYVAQDEPLECSGSFKFEQLGISLFESVRTDDPTAIEGLPLLRLGLALRRAGVL